MTRPWKPTRTLLRHPGGKWMLSDWTISNLPKTKKFFEGYFGSGSISMCIEPVEWHLIVEKDPQIVNLCQVLRDRESALLLQKLLALTMYAETELEIARIPTDDPIEQARRTIVRHTFSRDPGIESTKSWGAFRCNRKGGHVRNFRSYIKHMWELVERMQTINILGPGDVKNYALKYDESDMLFYFDPPYYEATRKRSRDLYRYEMKTEEEHRAKAEWVLQLKGMVVIAHYPCALYDELYLSQGWIRVDCQTKDGANDQRTEALYINPAAQEQRERDFEEARQASLLKAQQLQFNL